MKLPKFIFKRVIKKNTSLGDNKAFPPEDGVPFDYRLLKRRFEEVTINVQKISEVNDLNETNISNLLTRLIKRAKDLEEPIKENLERLCKNAVYRLFKIPSETVNLTCSIVDDVKPENGWSIMPEDADNRDFDFEDLYEFNEVQDVILKRRMIDAFIQGASYQCSKIDDLFIAELESLNQELPILYKKIIALNDYLLFVKEENITDEKPMQGGCVEVMLGMGDEKTDIKAQGVIFPFLLNETIRGFFELFASHGLPKDNRKAQYIISQADFLIAEPWDLRLGVGLWDMLAKDLEDTEILPFFFSNLCSLKVNEFNEVLREIFAHTKRGKSYLMHLYQEASEDMSYSINGYEDNIEQPIDANKSVINDEYLSVDDLDGYVVEENEE